MKKKKDLPIDWLPIDSRLFPFFSFSHVRGVARIFLLIEIFCAFFVVMGTLIATCLSTFS